MRYSFAQYIKGYALTIVAIFTICVGSFSFFHASPSTCTTMHDPSGGLSPVCTLGTPSPYQRLLIMQHRYFFPHDTCVISVETGALDCRSLSASGCDQSATTTDCATLPQPAPPELQPYVPPNPVQPTATWTSATGTPISLAGFSFELPAGWHGSAYSSAYTGNLHVLVQNDSNDRDFTVDCPHDGKGLEAATRLSNEERSFTADGTDYSVFFEKWTAPGNEPWYFIWVRTPQLGNSSTGSSGTYCLVQGTATSGVEEAMRAMYESWK